MYIATVILNRTEQEFWKMTPKKLQALFSVYIQLKKMENGGNSKEAVQEDTFIDNIL